jgi:hypothetical protein
MMCSNGGVTPCGPVTDVQVTFQRDILPSSSLLYCVPYSSLKIEANCSSETSVMFHQTQSILSQKIDLFIPTPVRTSTNYATACPQLHVRRLITNKE